MPTALRSSLSEQVEAITEAISGALHHPIIFPLKSSLEYELDVVRAARKTRVAQVQEKKSFRFEELLFTLLELRTAIAAWEGGNKGQVRFPFQRSTLSIPENTLRFAPHVK